MYMHVWDGCRGIEPRRGSDQLHNPHCHDDVCVNDTMMPTVVAWLHTPPRCLIQHENDWKEIGLGEVVRRRRYGEREEEGV